ncbi:MAG: hypothetical protein COB65_01215 [Thalassobium sp.]|nr:MAG: hypothetical protein COB65_01215 [Thalassobium sp.]
MSIFINTYLRYMKAIITLAVLLIQVSGISQTVGALPLYESLLDTILENNAPERLNKRNHQLYRDTTRNSVNYSKMQDVDCCNFSVAMMDKLVGPLPNGVELVSETNVELPMHFIQLETLDKDLVLYDRCDGSSPSYYVVGGYVYLAGVYEPTVWRVSKVLESDSTHMVATLVSSDGKGELLTDELSIQQTKIPYVYQIRVSGFWEGVRSYTTPDAIKNFDIVVNHCPTRKVLEYDFTKEVKGK